MQTGEYHSLKREDMIIGVLPMWHCDNITPVITLNTTHTESHHSPDERGENIFYIYMEHLYAEFS